MTHSISCIYTNNKCCREETVSLLLETILTGEKVESSIVGGIQVLLVLLGEKANR